jgi:hypothetical protein
MSGSDRLSDSETTLEIVLTTDQKGAIAESAIVHAATKLGVYVYRPCAEGGRYDLIFDTPVGLRRVQCKWAPLNGDVIVVRCRSSRRVKDGIRHRRYTASEVDVIAVYCAELDRCFYVPSARFDGHPELLLRVAACRNGQSKGVNWAEDFDFAARLGTLLGP